MGKNSTTIVSNSVGNLLFPNPSKGVRMKIRRLLLEGIRL